MPDKPTYICGGKRGKKYGGKKDGGKKQIFNPGPCHQPGLKREEIWREENVEGRKMAGRNRPLAGRNCY